MTPKQTAYAQARLAGLGPSAAYRAAYDCQNMSANAIAVEANHLERNPKVALMLTKAEAKVIEKTAKTAADIARVAWSIADDPEAPASARIAALALEAKRYREYSDKHELDARVGVMLVRQTRGLRAPK